MAPAPQEYRTQARKRGSHRYSGNSLLFHANYRQMQSIGFWNSLFIIQQLLKRKWSSRRDRHCPSCNPGFESRVTQILCKQKGYFLAVG